MLRQIGIPAVWCGGEEWFDLRQLSVQRGELGGAARLSRLCLDYATFEEVDLSGAELEGTLLRGALFRRTQLKGANLAHARVEDAIFDSGVLAEAIFTMAVGNRNTQFLNVDLDSAEFFRFAGPALFFSGSARRASFESAMLAGARFHAVDLTEARFWDAHLQSADLRGSTIDSADFRDADLPAVRLTAVKLSTQIRLLRTNVSSAYLGDIDLSKVDLSYAVWSNGEYRVGEESEADRAGDGGLSRLRLYRQAEATYRALAAKYHDLGYTEEACGLRFRSSEARRKVLALNGEAAGRGERAWLFLSRWIDGYSTQPLQWTGSVLWVLALFSVLNGAVLLFWTARVGPGRREPGPEALQRGHAEDSGAEVAEEGKAEPRKAKDGWRLGVRRLYRRATFGVYLSLDSFFLLMRPPVDFTPVLQLLFFRRVRHQLPRPRRLLRFAAAIEALFGVGLLYLGLRTLLFRLGAQ